MKKKIKEEGLLKCIYTGAGPDWWKLSKNNSPDGNKRTDITEEYEICISDIKTRKLIKKLKGHTDRIWSLAWSPDGKHIASVSADCNMRIWDVDRGECIQCENFMCCPMIKCEWDNGFLVTTSIRESKKVWDYKDKKGDKL